MASKKGVFSLKNVFFAAFLLLVVSFVFYGVLKEDESLITIKEGKLSIVSNYGAIDFSKSGDAYSQDELNAHITIRPNFIEVNSEFLSALNGPARLTLSAVPYKHPVILMDNQICRDCSIVSFLGGNLIFDVPHFTAFTTMANTELFIFDQSDLEGGNLPADANTSVKFYANYTNVTNKFAITPANDGWCNITFDFDAGKEFNMPFNTSSLLYEFSRNFSSIGFVEWNVTCNATSFVKFNLTDGIDILAPPAPVVNPKYIAAGLQRSRLNNSLNIYRIPLNTGEVLTLFAGNNWTNVTYPFPDGTNSLGWRCDPGPIVYKFDYTTNTCLPGGMCDTKLTQACGGIEFEYFINTSSQRIEVLWKVDSADVVFDLTFDDENITNTANFGFVAVDGNFSENYANESGFPTLNMSRFRMLVNSSMGNASGFETACSDSIDNDNDNLTDCGDPDCFSDPACFGGTHYGSGVNLKGPGETIANESIVVGTNLALFAAFEVFESANCTMMFKNRTNSVLSNFSSAKEAIVFGASAFVNFNYFFPVLENESYTWNVFCTGNSSNFTNNAGNLSFNIIPAGSVNVTLPGAYIGPPLGFDDCFKFDFTNSSACVNNTIGAVCIFDVPTSLCKPDASNVSCDSFCNNCLTELSCDQSAAACSFVFDVFAPGGGFCNPTAFGFGGGAGCADSCFACSTELECQTNGGGSSGTCEYINDTGISFCDYNIAGNSCSENCFMCLDSSSCANIGPSCTFNGTRQLCGPSSFDDEWCFDGIDNNANGLIDCQESSCSSSEACGGNLGLSTNQQAELQSVAAGLGLNSSNSLDLLLASLIKDFESGNIVDVGQDAVGDSLDPDFDIIDFGVKEAPASLGLGFNNISADLTVCGGEVRGMFGVYVNTDENESNGCTLLDNSSRDGFEFFYMVDIVGSGASPVVHRTAKRCANESANTWVPFLASFQLLDRFLCSDVDPTLIFVISKVDIGSPSTNDLLEFHLVSVNWTHNMTDPTDTAGSSLTYTMGTAEFTPPDCSADPTSCGSYSTVGGGFFTPSEDCFAGTGDEDQDGLTNCADPDCLGVPMCPASNISTAPQVINHFADEFTSEIHLTVVTNYPTNLTIEFFGQNRTCSNISTDYVSFNHPDFTYDDFQIANFVRIAGLVPTTSYYYKTFNCGSNALCSESACLNVTTLVSEQNTSVYIEFEAFGLPTSPTGNLSTFYRLNSSSAFTDISGNITNTNFLFNESNRLDVDFSWTNSQSDIPWEIQCVNADVVSNSRINFTKALNITDRSGNFDVGLRHLTFKNLYENLHCEKVRLKLPGVGANISHCNDDGNNCTDVSAYTSLVHNESNLSQSVWEIPASLGFSVYRVGGLMFTFSGSPNNVYLTDADGNNITGSTNETIIQFRRTTTGRRLAEFNISGSVNFGSTQVFYDDLISGVRNLGNNPNVASTFDLFVVNTNNAAGLYICEGVNTINQVDEVNCGGTGAPVTFAYEELGSTKSGITVVLDGSDYRILNLTGTGVGLINDTSLTIFDSAEGSSVDTGIATHFFALYENSTSGTSINPANCSIVFDETATGPFLMIYNGTHYNYTRTAGFASSANHTWNVTCSSDLFPTVFANDTIEITSAASSAAVPEFGEWALIIAILGAFLGIAIVRRD